MDLFPDLSKCVVPLGWTPAHTLAIGLFNCHIILFFTILMYKYVHEKWTTNTMWHRHGKWDRCLSKRPNVWDENNKRDRKQCFEPFLSSINHFQGVPWLCWLSLPMTLLRLRMLLIIAITSFCYDEPSLKKSRHLYVFFFFCLSIHNLTRIYPCSLDSNFMNLIMSLVALS